MNKKYVIVLVIVIAFIICLITIRKDKNSNSNINNNFEKNYIYEENGEVYVLKDVNTNEIILETIDEETAKYYINHPDYNPNPAGF